MCATISSSKFKGDQLARFTRASPVKTPPTLPAAYSAHGGRRGGGLSSSANALLSLCSTHCVGPLCRS